MKWRASVWPLAAVALTCLGSACSTASDGAPEARDAEWRADGCSLDVPREITESKNFQRIDKLFGYQGPPMIANTTPVTAAALKFPPFPESIGGLDAQSTTTIQPGDKVTFYSEEPPDHISYDDFYEAGGVTLEVRNFGPSGQSAMGVLAAGHRERNLPFALGTRNGLLSWEDPKDDRLIRPHRVFWTDHHTDYWLRADVPAPEIVKLARQIVCINKA